MPAVATQDYTDIKIDVANLKKEMSAMTTLVPRLDSTIEKLTEVSSNVSRMLAVHESRLEHQDKAAILVSEIVEKRRDENDVAHAALHEKISTQRIDLESQLSDAKDSIIDELKDMRKENTIAHETVGKRVGKLEKWIWLVSGAGVVGGWLISQALHFIENSPSIAHVVPLIH
jgi:archaellum component FlaC